jgi:hypothetical protein
MPPTQCTPLEPMLQQCYNPPLSSALESSQDYDAMRASDAAAAALHREAEHEQQTVALLIEIAAREQQAHPGNADFSSLAGKNMWNYYNNNNF